MDQEINYFVAYCNKITEEKKDFSIREYLGLRSSNK